MIEGYMTVSETAEKWDVSIRAVQLMCTHNRIEGAVKFGKAWAIPADARRPIDNRVTTGQYRNWRKNV